jgi:hypothetical protein
LRAAVSDIPHGFQYGLVVGGRHSILNPFHKRVESGLVARQHRSQLLAEGLVRVLRVGIIVKRVYVSASLYRVVALQMGLSDADLARN